MSRGPVTISTPSQHWGITNPGGNSTSASIVKPGQISSGSSPRSNAAGSANGLTTTGDGVIAWGESGAESNSGIQLSFYGVGADTNTGLASVYGWSSSIANPGGGPLRLWFPVLLCSVSFELDSGQVAGLTNTIIPPTASQYWATTITLVTGNSGISCEVVSPGHGGDIAHLIVDSKGSRYLEVRYGLNSSSTSLNGTWRGI